MRRLDSLPQGFEALRGKVDYVQRHSNNEYTSSCPQCHGEPHPNGELPDRFILFVASKATGGPLGWCRRCDYKWWPGRDEGSKLTPEQVDQWRREREEREAEKLAKSQAAYNQAISLIRKERPWERYHASMTAEIVALWERRGIIQEFQTYWQLGFREEIPVWLPDGTEYRSPALSIPIWGAGWEILNIRYRLIHPPEIPAWSRYRYRQEYDAWTPQPFMTDPEAGYDTEHFLLLEGEIKAGVTYITLNSARWQVLGMVGKNMWESLVPKLKGKDVVICLDPGELELSVKIARAMGGRVMRLPDKIDDAIVAGALDKRGIFSAIRNARRVSWEG